MVDAEERVNRLLGSKIRASSPEARRRAAVRSRPDPQHAQSRVLAVLHGKASSSSIMHAVGLFHIETIQQGAHLNPRLGDDPPVGPASATTVSRWEGPLPGLDRFFDAQQDPVFEQLTSSKYLILKSVNRRPPIKGAAMSSGSYRDH